jgi:hypothetical protein
MVRGVTAHRLLRPTLLAALAGLTLSCGRAYPLDAGCYEMTATEVLRDECGLLPSQQGLWNGRLQMTGIVVRMDYALLDMQLIGSFLGGTDAFSIDGSVANVKVPINSQECLLDQVSVHMEGAPTERSVTAFDGVVRVRYDTRRPDTCVCELWTRFQAEYADDSVCPVPPTSVE